MHALISLPGCIIEHIEQINEMLLVSARTTEVAATCPSCAQSSRRIHSHYTRYPSDLPLSDNHVRLQLHVRRFRCLNPTCAKQTFSEGLPYLLESYARRTSRLANAQCELGIALGGEASARLLGRLHMPVSADTVLRLIRRCPLPVTKTPRVLGVDDWAMRKGRTYGTILIDLETHRPVDLLPERSAEVLTTWLKEHPGVEIITRDRSTEYARGASEGAPEATQVADRWHLLQNARQMLERFFERIHSRLRSLPADHEMTTDEPSELPKAPPPRREEPFRRTTSEQLASCESRARRLALFETIKHLRAENKSILAISKELAITRTTVRRYAYAEAFPERAKQPRASILDPYIPYLDARHQEGCENASQLWREIQRQGYEGSKRQVLVWLRDRRKALAPTTPGPYREAVEARRRAKVATTATNSSPELPSARKLAWLCAQKPSELPMEDAAVLARIKQDHEVARLHVLGQEFMTMIHQRTSQTLDSWLQACMTSGVGVLHTFAKGIEQDYAAVKAALDLPWSNGQTEGQVTRLKFIKRQMYGRANFDLLRQRVLLMT